MRPSLSIKPQGANGERGAGHTISCEVAVTDGSMPVATHRIQLVLPQRAVGRADAYWSVRYHRDVEVTREALVFTAGGHKKTRILDRDFRLRAVGQGAYVGASTPHWVQLGVGLDAVTFKHSVGLKMGCSPTHATPDPRRCSSSRPLIRHTAYRLSSMTKEITRLGGTGPVTSAIVQRMSQSMTQLRGPPVGWISA